MVTVSILCPPNKADGINTHATELGRTKGLGRVQEAAMIFILS